MATKKDSKSKPVKKATAKIKDLATKKNPKGGPNNGIFLNHNETVV